MQVSLQSKLITILVASHLIFKLDEFSGDGALLHVVGFVSSRFMIPQLLIICHISIIQYVFRENRSESIEVFIE